MPVVINEVAWAGNSSAYSADEWIELYNRTSKSINLTNWILYSATDLSPYLTLSGTIAAKGYYLIERSPDNATISDIVADLAVSFGNGLNNSGENLILSHASSTIDQIPYCYNWYAGSSNYYSMERYDPDIVGTDASNWGRIIQQSEMAKTPAGKPQRHAQSAKQRQLSHQQRANRFFQSHSFRFPQSVSG